MPGGKQKVYTMEEKMQAAIAYAITGSANRAAKMCNIPQPTFHTWTTKDWWPDLVTQARNHKDQAMDGQITGLMHTATGLLAERMASGDPYVLKDGTVGYKPTTARDMATILGILTDKRVIMRGGKKLETKNQTAAEVLNDIKNALAEMAKPRPVKKEEKEEVITH